MSTDNAITQHTPTPWGSRHVTFSKSDWIELLPKNGITCVCSGGDVVAAIWGTDDACKTDDDAKANAALIVRAVNAHADLVAALRAIHEYWTESATRGMLSAGAMITDGDDTIYEVVSAALAKAGA